MTYYVVMKRWMLFWAVATTLAFGGTGPTREEIYAADPNVKALCALKYVTFWFPMGGGRPAGVVLVRRILREKEPLPFLVAAYNHGSPAAKVYALAGIHVAFPELFELCRKDVVGRYNPDITGSAGCMAYTGSFLEHVIRIEHGEYDPLLAVDAPSSADSN